MKEKVYDHIPTKEELIIDFSNNSIVDDDPASSNYKRVLTYPKIDYFKVFLNILLYIISILVIIFVEVKFFNIKTIYKIFIPIVISIIYCFIRLSSILIFIVECYQLIAPTKIRMRCRFEPSCSEYMILSIKKYGAIKGLIKGIKRLKRCKYPNGGYDLP